MNKQLVTAVVVLFLLPGWSNEKGQPALSTSAILEDNVPQPISLVIPPINSRNNPDYATRAITHRIYSEVSSLQMVELVNDSIIEMKLFDVIDLSTTQAIWKDNSMSHGTNCNGYDCSMEVGRLTGAEQVLLSFLEKTENGTRFELKMVDTKSGLIIRKESMIITGTKRHFITRAIPDLIRQVSRVRMLNVTRLENEDYIPVNKESPLQVKNNNGINRPWYWAAGGGTLAAGLATAYFWFNLPEEKPEQVHMSEVVNIE